jgi:hypothetical protein
VRHAGIGVLQCADFARINVDAMCGNDLGFEQAEFLYVWHNRHALFVAHVFHLEGGLGDMDVKRHVKFFGEIHAGADNFRVGGVGGMRCNGRDDERMSLPLFDEFARVGE